MKGRGGGAGLRSCDRHAIKWRMALFPWKSRDLVKNNICLLLVGRGRRGYMPFVCVEVLRSINPIGSCRARSVYLTKRLFSWGLTTQQPLWVILCRLLEKGSKEIEEIVKEMKERERNERETGMKMKKQKK